MGLAAAKPAALGPDELLTPVSDEKERLEGIAGIYDAASDFDGVLTRFAFRFLSPRLSGGRTLEMGCSSGVMTALLIGRVSALEVVDGSRSYLDQVAERLGRREAVFHHSLFEDFEPRGGFADIVMARALEHLEDPGSVLRRVANWLEPGGTLHVMVPNALSFHRLIGVAMNILPEPHGASERDRMFGHRRVYDPNSLRGELERAGFEVLEEGGVFLKFLSNAQMATLDPALWEALYQVGRSFPRHAAEIYARCRARAEPA